MPVEDSFGRLLAGLGSLFPASLVGPSEWQRLLALAYSLPAHVIDDRFGFEFALCDPEPAADMCVVAPFGSRLAEFYARQGAMAPADSASAALGAFLAKQSSDPQALHAMEEAAGAILEYDLAGAPPPQPGPPGVFIVPRDPRDESCMRGLFGDPETLAAVLWAVARWTPDAAIRQQMHRAYQLMAPFGSVAQAGIMPGRPQRAIRLLIAPDSCENSLKIVERLNWPGSVAEVARVASSLAEVTSPGFSLSVDITAQGVSPRLGLEFHRPVEWHELDHAGWSRLIDRLQEGGWCLPEKASGLKAWPRVENVFDRGRVYRVRQSINHIKVVVDRGTTAAKAYVGALMQQAA